MKSLDTNILARWIVRDVPHQTKIVDDILFGTENYFVSSVVFIELDFLLSKLYTFPRPLIARHIQAIMELPSLSCNETVLWQALEFYNQHQSLSLADCILSAEAILSNRAPLLTFDKALAKKLPGSVVEL